MTRASRSLRLTEIALCVLGVSLLGVAVEETLGRWNYQRQQERVLDRGPAVSVIRDNREIAVALDKVPPEGGRVGQPVLHFSPAERLAVSAPLKEPKGRAPAVDPSALGRIEIPRLGVAAIVKVGADRGTLARAVGLVPGSARPGEIGNMVLAGHRDTFFRPLREIKLNDRIRMIVPPHIYEYRVQSLRVVTPEETGVLDSNGVEELTLVTCYPFRFIGPAPDRFIVSATRVN